MHLCVSAALVWKTSFHLDYRASIDVHVTLYMYTQRLTFISVAISLHVQFYSFKSFRHKEELPSRILRNLRRRQIHQFLFTPISFNFPSIFRSCLVRFSFYQSLFAMQFPRPYTFFYRQAGTSVLKSPVWFEKITRYHLDQFFKSLGMWHIYIVLAHSGTLYPLVTTLQLLR